MSTQSHSDQSVCVTDTDLPFINPFVSIGRTDMSKGRVLNSAIRRTGTSTEISVSKV